jgi:hypothetical protein
MADGFAWKDDFGGAETAAAEQPEQGEILPGFRSVIKEVQALTRQSQPDEIARLISVIATGRFTGVEQDTLLASMSYQTGVKERTLRSDLKDARALVKTEAPSAPEMRRLSTELSTQWHS